MARSPAQFVESLSEPLGQEMAAREVHRALEEAKLNRDDRRPYALRLLRFRLQANLSGMMGPSIAREITDRYLPFRSVAPDQRRADVPLIENRIEAFRSNLTGLAAETR